MTISAGILGATGYTGAELIRLIHGHPGMRLDWAAAHSQAGRRLGEVLPGLPGELADLKLAHVDDPLPDGLDLVFCALPHAASAAAAKRALDAGCRVVDLSADFRHDRHERYSEAYGLEHPFPELLKDAVYGLTEHVREKLAGARLVANPGCYPTCSLLPLLPLARAGVIDTASIIIDAKSGTSGAGRSARQDLLYCEINESVRAYGLPRHRHTWEIEDALARLAGVRAPVRFTPHILPMTRGMLATLHLSGTDAKSWRALLADHYADEPFVRVLPEGALPSTADVRGSNRCDIAVVVQDERHAVVLSAIDNLLKGASGQAVQNANRMFGLEETAGLSPLPVWP